jgi:hypothetical protein
MGSWCIAVSVAAVRGRRIVDPRSTLQRKSPQPGIFPLDIPTTVGSNKIEENAMEGACRRLKTPHFCAHVLPIGRESPKAENLLITKGKVLGFCLPKAENILKTSQLLETQNKGLDMANRSPGDKVLKTQGRTAGSRKNEAGNLLKSKVVTKNRRTSGGRFDKGVAETIILPSANQGECSQVGSGNHCFAAMSPGGIRSVQDRILSAPRTQIGREGFKVDELGLRED